MRSMSFPNAEAQPDTYKGAYWYTGTGDNGGVHINSGVLNFWFYLLSQGGTGTNDLGNAYAVTSIGIAKAAKIVYRMESVYLSSSSNYSVARTYGIQAAQDLYGVGSVEATSVANAFYAVGIGTAATNTIGLGDEGAAVQGFVGSLNKQASNLNVYLYPNPATELVQLEIEDRNNAEALHVAIYSISGKLIQNSVLAPQQYGLDVTQLPKGNYLLQVRQGDQVGHQRLMKQ